MLYHANVLKKFDVRAMDGDIGTVHDLYFDDEKWTVRYIVVDTKKWLPGRKVLLSPIGFDEVNIEQGQIDAYASKEEIKQSPDISADKPVSREKEAALSSYYGWNQYWGGPALWGSYSYPKPMPVQQDKLNEMPEANEENHLRSYKELTGILGSYHIKAIDGEIGHVSDFLIDSDTWEVRYMIIDTSNWLFGKQILVSPEWIEDISWSEQIITVDLSKDTIKNGPEYDPNIPITPDIEQKLFSLYGKTKVY